MALRQQVLLLWLEEAALSMAPVAWAFHDGTGGRGPGLPEGDPPYPSGEAALCDGWMLLQTPHVPPLARDDDATPSYLSFEFVFERRVDVDVGDGDGDEEAA
ncbi:MAG: hypothetical protein ACQGVC_15960 [Myxococcota bacterium]